jgi:sensor histidine kinase YesM
VCENSTSKKTDPADPNSGLGLSLVKQRLDLLYSEHYSLQVEAKENIFRAQCEIFDEANKVYNN